MASATPRPTWSREFVLVFSSLKVGIGLLLAIAAASIIGTILPQDEGPGVVMNGEFAPWLKQLMLAVQAYDVYHAFWFQFLLALLFVNLAVCTYIRFPPTWRRYAMVAPAMPPVASTQEAVALPGPPTPRRLDMFRKRGYTLTEAKDGAFFAEKAKFVRLGPTIIHISLFMIITGALVGGLTGLKNSFPLMLGQTTKSSTVVNDSYLKGRFYLTPRPFTLRLDDFRMEFRPNGQVKQYYSQVTVSPEGGVPYHQTLWVNEPLVVDGMYFYQSYWGLGGVTFHLGDQTRTLALTQAKIGGFMSPPFHLGAGGKAGDRHNEFMFFIRSMNEPAMLISTKNFQPVAELVPGIDRKFEGQAFGISQYQLFSGLETKKDPGIPLVYLGCGLLVFGLVLVPFSHREVWIRQHEGIWVLAGRTHKGRVMLRKEIEEIAERWGSDALASGSPDAGHLVVAT